MGGDSIGIIIGLLIALVIVIVVCGLRLVPQTYEYVVERLGKYHATWTAGLHYKVPFIDKVMKRTSGHMFNMWIMKRDVLNSYCTWLFDILFELEKRIDVSKYDSFHARFFGRVSNNGMRYGFS